VRLVKSQLVGAVFVVSAFPLKVGLQLLALVILFAAGLEVAVNFCVLSVRSQALRLRLDAFSLQLPMEAVGVSLLVQVVVVPLNVLGVVVRADPKIVELVFEVGGE
jgi:hypothetical protein